jgi:hypothetical protein
MAGWRSCLRTGAQREGGPDLTGLCCLRSAQAGPREAGARAIAVGKTYERATQLSP